MAAKHTEEGGNLSWVFLGLLTLALPPSACGLQLVRQPPKVPEAALMECVAPTNSSRLCDPDQTLTDNQRRNMAELVAKCEREAVDTVAFTLFLAHNLTFSDRTTAPPDATEGDRDAAASPVDRLLTAVLASDVPSDPEPRRLFVVALNDPFQVQVWYSGALNDTLTREECEAAVSSAAQANHSSVLHALHSLCQSVHRDSPKFAHITGRWLVFTTLWLVFVFVFVLLVGSISTYLMRLRRIRKRKAVSGEEEETEPVRVVSGRGLNNPLSADFGDLTTVVYKSPGHVMLGTCDITAVGAQDCVSTENLLNT